MRVNLWRQERLPWWPVINILYYKAAELRSMFIEVLTRVHQHHPLLRPSQSLTLRERVIGGLGFSLSAGLSFGAIARSYRGAGGTSITSTSPNELLLAPAGGSPGGGAGGSAAAGQQASRVSPIGALVGADNEAPSHRNLLLWLIRLINADPFLMLHVRTA